LSEDDSPSSDHLVLLTSRRFPQLDLVAFRVNNPPELPESVSSNLSNTLQDNARMSDGDVEQDLDTAGSAIQAFAPGGLWGLAVGGVLAVVALALGRLRRSRAAQ
jgi:hypothetical protein